MKDRLRLGPGRPEQPSYFCESYKQFFDHALPRFMQVAAAVEKGQLTRRTRPAKRVRLQAVEKGQLTRRTRPAKRVRLHIE